jgi:Arc/MetJ-type ribon-helix-helix transcriptional regulator
VTVELKAETERLVQEEIRRGHFHSVDELIVQGVQAWRERHQDSQLGEAPAGQRQSEGRKNLAQLFAESPFKGLSIDFERFSDTLPPTDL